MAKNRRRLFGRGGSKRSNKSSEQPERRGSILSRRGKGSKKRNSLYTKGGEYTLEGKNYVGDYHIMEDGTPMTGKSHKGRGLFGFRSKKKRSKTLVAVPDDVDTRYPCQYCGNKEGHFIDAEFVSIAWGGELRKLGLEWTGYELEKIEG